MLFASIYANLYFQVTERILKDLVGPSAKERWLYWKYATEEQTKRSAVKSELEKILYSDYVSFL